MSSLPHHPSLRHLRRQARELQRATGQPLHEAQRQLAASYGFADWARLKRVVDAGETVLEWSSRLLGKHEFEALRDAGQTPPPSAIVDALRHPNPRVRFECLGMLDHLADEDVIPQMTEAARDPVPRVRRMAVHALGCQACKPTSLCADLNDVFVPIAERDPVWRVRQEAVLSIAQQPATSRSKAVLAHVAQDDAHPTVRRQAEWALGIQRGHGHSYGVRARAPS